MRRLSLAALFLSVPATRQDPAPPPTPVPPVQTPATPRELFLKNCAQCHGENGDGNGVQKLEKAARSFKDGGFSYGNTPEALLRTLTFGIPGTPMPSFSSALTEAQRKELAAYVITLGPEVVKVEASETRLVVKDVPLFVRGKLPPIVEGASETVRGLLVGTPDGFTFEYAVDDVHLLGVRQGDFVERRDWGGRGGDALMPLGKVVLRSDPAPTVAPWRWAPTGAGFESNACRARFLGTRVDGSAAHLSYRLEADVKPRSERSGPPKGKLAAVPIAIEADESIRATTASAGSGYRRELSLDGRGLKPEQPGVLLWTVWGARTKFASIDSGARWIAVPAGDGRFLLALLAPESVGVLGVEEGSLLVSVPMDRARRDVVRVDLILLPAWNDEVRRALVEEPKR